MPLIAVGVNHKTAPVSIREKISFAPEKMVEALNSLVSGAQASEAVIVSTCNRTELYCAVAEEVGVDLCLENVWNGMFYSPLEFASFIDSFTSNRLGVYFDVGNVLGYHQHPPYWIELLGKRIKRVHIKDFTENFGFVGGYMFCPLGAGQVPWKDSMQALKAIGYDQTIVAEMLPWDPGQLQRTSLEMDRIFALAK